VARRCIPQLWGLFGWYESTTRGETPQYRANVTFLLQRSPASAAMLESIAPQTRAANRMSETLESPNRDSYPRGTGSSHDVADRRKRRRALISAPIRVRAVHVTLGGPDEVSTTLDVSRNGVLFTTSLTTFSPGMEVAVTFPYAKSPQTPRTEQSGRVVRISEMQGNRRSVAVALGLGVGEDIIDAAGRTLVARQPAPGQEPVTKKPLVLVVDADQAVRESVKACLGCEGYEVFAVSCAAEAHEVLKMFTPALLIAEIEGDNLPGYELCAHCKVTPRLKTVPVMLLTRSAYPSDYANAHSLGAVVCMAKPYRQERLAHVVRLLAPTQQHKQHLAPVRPIDPDRRCSGRGRKSPATCTPLQERRLWRF
jgi:CheY-like chemotaxis protein